jgi:hypothetical protein
MRWLSPFFNILQEGGTAGVCLYALAQSSVRLQYFVRDGHTSPISRWFGRILWLFGSAVLAFGPFFGRL